MPAVQNAIRLLFAVTLVSGEHVGLTTFGEAR